MPFFDHSVSATPGRLPDEHEVVKKWTAAIARSDGFDAMRIAAEKRTEGILGNSRRQHYGHAALLVASCVAFAPKSRSAELLRWATDLRQQYRRRHAFREELARACESLGVFVPA